MSDPTLTTLREGDVVRAFDPRTLGVVKHGRVISIGQKYAVIDFGLTGRAKVLGRDVVANEGQDSAH